MTVIWLAQERIGALVSPIDGSSYQRTMIRALVVAAIADFVLVAIANILLCERAGEVHGPLDRSSSWVEVAARAFDRDREPAYPSP